MKESTILIVEDNRINRLLIQNQLKKKGLAFDTEPAEEERISILDSCYKWKGRD
jgi:CheY-like chemotaxis protein